MTRLRGISQPGTSDFCRTKALPDIFNRSNLKYSAFSGLKVDSGRRKKKQSKKKGAKPENSIQIGVNEHNLKKGS